MSMEYKAVDRGQRAVTSPRRPMVGLRLALTAQRTRIEKCLAASLTESVLTSRDPSMTHDHWHTSHTHLRWRESYGPTTKHFDDPVDPPATTTQPHYHLIYTHHHDCEKPPQRFALNSVPTVWEDTPAANLRISSSPSRSSHRFFVSFYDLNFLRAASLPLLRLDGFSYLRKEQ